MRATYTYAVLGVSLAAYDEIRAKLEAAGYQHAFINGDEIDMHGLALARGPEGPRAREGVYCDVCGGLGARLEQRPGGWIHACETGHKWIAP